MKLVFEETEEAKFAMAPMIDMVFLLLVFFMSASHLSTRKSMPMEIPFASRGVVPAERPDRWVVNVTAEGDIYSGTQPVTVDELKTMIGERLKEDPRLKVYLRADAASQHKGVKKVMGAMAEAGVDDLIFGVYVPSGSGEGTE